MTEYISDRGVMVQRYHTCEWRHCHEEVDMHPEIGHGGEDSGHYYCVRHLSWVIEGNPTCPECGGETTERRFWNHYSETGGDTFVPCLRPCPPQPTEVED